MPKTYIHALTKCIQQSAFKYTIPSCMSANMPLTRHEYNSQCLFLQCTLVLIYIILFISFMYLTIHELELWPMCWHILHTLPIVFPINWMPSFSTRTLHQEYIYVVFISVSKKVAFQVLFKGRKILVPVWFITFPYPYLDISNQVLVSYMTSLLAFIPITSSYLLILWLLSHNQINMTFYYVSVCIQKLKDLN